MPFDLGNIASNAASGAINTGLGLLLEGHNDRRQIKQQQKLQNMQIAGSKELTDYNQQKQLDLWDKTNYSAQRAQLEKAGLNAALLYGQSGGGGATANISSGSVSGGSAPMGGGEVLALQQLGLQREMQQAQIENIKANTNKTNVETGIVAETGMNQALANIDKTVADTGSSKAQTAWTWVKADIEEINKKYTASTLQENLNLLEHNVDNAYEALKQNRVKTYLDQATRDKAQEAIELGVIEQITRIALGNSSIEVNDKAIEQMTQNIANSIRGLDQTDTKLKIEKFKAEIEANYPGASKIVGRALDGAVETLDRIMKGGRQKTHEIK